MRVVVLVDGEHAPAAIRAAIGRIRSGGDDVVGAILLGGTEKLGPDSAYGVELDRRGEPALRGMIDDSRPDVVLDLSDEPVVSLRDRLRLAAVANARGVRYAGADFDLRPPRLERVLTKPSIRVIATGKRAGKTAVTGALVRRAVARGLRPVVVAMGRGGPERPAVLEAGAVLGAAELLAIADRGDHAASDYLEDALTTGVATIGCRRVGGGISGGVWDSNVAAGARLAQARSEDLVVIDGSGAAVPPVAVGSGIVCVPAGSEPDALRVLLSDLAVVTMVGDNPPATFTESAIRGVGNRIDIVRAVLRPTPLGSIAGRRVLFCCTAPPIAAPELRRHLETVYGCVVTGMSHSLANRDVLSRELDADAGYDVLLTELKGAAVDIAVRRAVQRDVEVVFADSVPEGVGLEEAFDAVVESAIARA